MKKFDVRIVELSHESLSQVMDVQAASYLPNYQEERSCFQTMLEVFPEGCFGAFAGDIIAGYLFCHPYFLHQPKPLNFALTLTHTENCLYIHDLNISPKFRGQRIAKLLVKHAFQLRESKGYPSIALISVQNSEKFWENQGFTSLSTINYGAQKSVYMVRSFPD